MVPETETTRDRDRDRDPLFRIRERRWLDSALREDAGLSRLDRDRTDGLLPDAKKQQQQQQQQQPLQPGPPQSPIAFGDELQYWPDRVHLIFTLKLPIIIMKLANGKK